MIRCVPLFPRPPIYDSPMTLHLREDVYCCVANGKTVLLDLRADRYIALSPGTASALQSLLDNSTTDGPPPSALLPLVEAGLVENSNDMPPPPAPLQTPTQSVLSLTLPRPSLLRLLEAFSHQVHATRSLARHGFYATIDRIRRRKAKALQATQTNRSVLPHAILAANLRLGRYVRAQDRCLPRAIGLIELLARHDAYPCLVMAVRMKPFEAHAWVQWDDMVLNDTVDQVRRYTPILVI